MVEREKMERKGDGRGGKARMGGRGGGKERRIVGECIHEIYLEGLKGRR